MYIKGTRKEGSCGGLNEILQQVQEVDAWSPVGGTIWEGLEGVALLEGVCHGTWALRVYSHASFTFNSFSLSCICH